MHALHLPQTGPLVGILYYFWSSLPQRSGPIDRHQRTISRPTATTVHVHVRPARFLRFRRMNAHLEINIYASLKRGTQSSHGLSRDRGARAAPRPHPLKSWRRILSVVSAVVRSLAIIRSHVGDEPGDGTEPSILPMACMFFSGDWRYVRKRLPNAWCWDVEYNSPYAKDGSQNGCWTCTPIDAAEPKNYPLNIARAPVVLPVEYRWSPGGGVTPPPDPRPTARIDCRLKVPLEVVRDIFITFEGCVGFYLLINGLLQIIVPDDFDTAWASSHLPQRFGGLKVCYIERDLEPSMLSERRSTVGLFHLDSQYKTPLKPSELPGLRSWPSSRPIVSNIPQLRHPSVLSLAASQSIQLNDCIEARSCFTYGKRRCSGCIGLRVAREDAPFIVMSTHVITESISVKLRWNTMFDRNNDEHFQQMNGSWNAYTVIWASNRKIGSIHKTFDKEAKIYPNGFNHDVTLIKPTSPDAVKDIVSPIPNMGWLNHDSWSSLRQKKSTVKFLADTEGSQSAKSIKCSRPSDVLVVGEGIFLNQKAAAGGSKSLREHDVSTWKDLVSRAILYRVYPDFDPPNGHSGTALYADGTREDGTQGPGIVGFQSFVQRSGHVQSFEMEGSALERRLHMGRVAFYGAFEVPAELKEYDIV